MNERTNKAKEKARKEKEEYQELPPAKLILVWIIKAGQLTEHEQKDYKRPPSPTNMKEEKKEEEI
jgi:hypothetical protein